MVKHVPTRKSAKMRYWLQVRPDPLRTSPLCVLSIMLRKEYLTPEVDIVHLTPEACVLTGSQNGTGANVTYDSESSFDSFFGS